MKQGFAINGYVMVDIKMANSLSTEGMQMLQAMQSSSSAYAALKILEAQGLWNFFMTSNQCSRIEFVH